MLNISQNMSKGYLLNIVFNDKTSFIYQVKRRDESEEKKEKRFFVINFFLSLFE